MDQLPDNPDSHDETAQEISLDDALQLAIRLHQSNQLEQADEIYRKLLDMVPESPSILHFFGLLQHQRGDSEQGVACIKKALEYAPDYIDAHNNLGNIYLQTGQSELAEPLFRRVIELKPDFVAAHANLGVVLKDLKRFNEAVEYLLKAVDLKPDEAQYYQNLGNTYRAMREYRGAVEMYRKALALKPFDTNTFRKLSSTFYVMGEMECCIEVLAQWLEYDPVNATALHMHAAYTRQNAPPRASDAYVRETFDGFAASFDGVLKRLEYQAPFLVEQALQQVQPGPDSWHWLDAGCGTGLSGALLRPLVKHLVGIDLSPKMLERARLRGVYDELFEAELTAFFSQAASTYDGISSVDTFCYFGDLTGAVSAAVNALKPNGWFIFTLEKHEESESPEGFRLNVHGRYSHAESYVRKTLTDAGFSVHKIETAALRRERSDHVAGMVVTAQLQ